MSSQPCFIHLHLHTEYSLVDGLIDIKPLVKRCVAENMPAVAVTDQSNLFALVKFYRAAQEAGIKPLAGADIHLEDPLNPDTPHALTLLVQNGTGYQHLTALISRAYQENQHQGVPQVKTEWLHTLHEGLIVLSGGLRGDVGKALMAGHCSEANRLLTDWLAVFGDRYYLELQRTGRPGEESYIEQAIALAANHHVPVVATNDVRFLDSDDFEAHEARVCIHQGRVLDDPERPRNYTDQQFFRSAGDMIELFADLPEALENTVEIARRCTLNLTLGQNFLPSFPVPEGMSTEDYFAEESRRGLEERLAVLYPADTEPNRQQRQSYRNRLELEIGVINQMKFPGYFLIVADFIQWAKKKGIPVGPGRGSGAGSLVAYALKITDLDPIAFDLLFERFLNPERVSMPDFDIDFCMERRDEVIEYVAETYGRDKVSQIITYGSMAAKAVVRDVGRVLGHPYPFVDRIAKLIPFELGITLDKALTDSEDLKRLYEGDEDVKTLIDLARSLEGVTRNAGKHAGGVVIAPSKLVDFAPLYCEEDGNNLVTQFDKDDVEAVGLVKFDFLGLRTLTIIDWALRPINERRLAVGEAPLHIDRIPCDDPKTYALLKKCQTTAVFQLESRGMKDLIRRLQPDCFEDIIALVALFRPGPLQSGMVDDYINVKHGRAQAEYPHPVLEPILKPTNGVIVYQEQVMQIARDMAGYTLGGADLLRRAMGKKKPEEMARQREIFVSGAVGLGVPADTAGYIFDLMEKFAGYGFNKSHSAAYALVSYQTAWLKAHYPADFMAAVLSADMDNTDKIVVLIEECRQMKLQILPPDVNRSLYSFSVQKESSLRYGLGAIKGVGESAILEVLAERDKNGDYADLFDFCKRIDLRKVNRRVLEAFIRAGVLDGFGPHRAQLLAQLEEAIKRAEQYGNMEAAGQEDLFGLGGVSEATLTTFNPASTAEVDAWSDTEKLNQERQVLGFYLSGHPLDPYQAELRHIVTDRLGPLLESTVAEKSGYRRQENRTVAAGLVVEVRTRISKTGKRMSFAVFDDPGGKLDVAVYSDVLEQYGHLLVKDALLVAEGPLGFDEFAGQPRLKAEHLYTIEQARANQLRSITLQWPVTVRERAEGPSPDHFADLLRDYQGGTCTLFVEYRTESAKTLLELGNAWKIRPDDTLLKQLNRTFGPERIQLQYRRAA
ncbi:DNA polymerase III subunit alpha [Candidatus Woesearchaeota archaeon]|nr:DNA polymerase III subunit alpha [Candidatus Woesearchaeota archaeon]